MEGGLHHLFYLSVVSCFLIHTVFSYSVISDQNQKEEKNKGQRKFVLRPRYGGNGKRSQEYFFHDELQNSDGSERRGKQSMIEPARDHKTKKDEERSQGATPYRVRHRYMGGKSNKMDTKMDHRDEMMTNDNMRGILILNDDINGRLKDLIEKALEKRSLGSHLATKTNDGSDRHGIESMVEDVGYHTMEDDQERMRGYTPYRVRHRYVGVGKKKKDVKTNHKDETKSDNF